LIAAPARSLSITLTGAPRSGGNVMKLFRSFAAALIAAAFLAQAYFVTPALAQCSTVGGYGSSTVQSPGSAQAGCGPSWAIHALHPLDDGALGSYSHALASGAMAAGLASASPVYSFRYTGTGTAVIRRVRVSVAGTATAFVAGTAQLQMFSARAFTASDSGGTAATLTGNNGKLRTSMGTTGVGDMRIASTATLTAGTRTLDADPLAAIDFAIGTAVSVQYAGPSQVLYEPKAGEYPLALATNEGFVIQATVPATGTWQFTVQVEWDELPAF
jgi:hypothetical protein